LVLKEGLSAYAALPKSILKLTQRVGREGVAYIALKSGNKGAYLGYKLANAEIKLADVTAQQVFANIEWATKNGIILEKIEDVKYLDQAGKEFKGTLELVKQEDGKLGVKVSGIKFIARTGEELKTYLNALSDFPKGVTYEGSIYRSLTIESQETYFAVAEKMTDHHIYSSWGRYDLDKAENAMYLSKTINGNKTEVLSYVNDWKKWNTYEFKNIKADNLLDLTDDVVRQKLRTQYDDLVRDVVKTSSDDSKIINYEMTNVIASWARQKGYNGIIAPGARGAKDYQNIILFEQSYIDKMLTGKTIEKIKK
jgi:hypothetical protein